MEWRSLSSVRHFFEADWNLTNGFSFHMDGDPVFTNVPVTNFSPQACDSFVWAARSGSCTEDLALDNIVVVTGNDQAPLPTMSPYFATTNNGTNLGPTDSFEVNIPANAFDGDTTTEWSLYQNSYAGGFIGATVTPAPVSIYLLTSALEAPGGDPQTWTLEGSTNGGASWVVCGGGSGSFLWRGETRAWLASNTTAFGAYRLNISTNHGDPHYTQLDELQLFQANPGTGNIPVVIPWTATSAPSQLWTCLATSADGTKLAAGRLNAGISTSTNFGATWQATGAPDNDWTCIASSADGTKLAATAFQDAGGNAGLIYTSTNGGATWQAASAPATCWSSIASSADGTKLAAVANEDMNDHPGLIYTSTNSGANWHVAGAPSNFWASIASSDDGTKLAAACEFGANLNAGLIYTSTDSGATWTVTSAPANAWVSLASSADGSKLAAVANEAPRGAFGSLVSGLIYTSTNSGAAWQATGAPSNLWASISSSADGYNLAAAASHNRKGMPGLIYTSTNAGAAWTTASAPSNMWASIASSADGTKLAADSVHTVGYNPGMIYTWQLPPLSLAPSTNNLAIMWTTNQTGLVLQQTPDLATPNWRTATAEQSVITNDQYQITISPTNSHQFFRIGPP